MGNKESGTIYFIAGLLLGGILGAGIGMVLTPTDGEEARMQLKKTGSKMLKKSLSAWEDFEEEQLSPAFSKIADKVKEKVSEVQTTGVGKAVEKVIDKVQSVTGTSTDADETAAKPTKTKKA